MIFEESASIQRKLEILSDAAKFDVACTSSGVDKKGQKGQIGNSIAAGICHSFSADGRCISLLKILYTNECIFDCKYCCNRSSNDTPRVSFTPKELCELTIEFYRRNYIEGLFLSSGIHISPNHTMEQICEALRMLREEYHFNGYIHCKAIPGADPELIDLAGWYADRMSVNLELPTAESLHALAPHKSRKNILKPIRQIQLSRERNIEYLGTKKQAIYLPDKKSKDNKKNAILDLGDTGIVPIKKEEWKKRSFVPAGQSSQMIVGASDESDYQIMKVSEGLYQKFDLKRVFYSAFVNVNQDSNLPSTEGGPNMLREHRLYQADWLLRFYGFETDELLNERHQNFNVFLDPKCDWALSHLEHFPVEINRADYYTLLRVPGIGVTSARKILMARKTAVLNFKDLKKLGVVLKRAVYFIVCDGKPMYPIKLQEDYITRQLLNGSGASVKGITGDIRYEQLSLFDQNDFMKTNQGIYLTGIS